MGAGILMGRCVFGRAPKFHSGWNATIGCTGSASVSAIPSSELSERRRSKGSPIDSRFILLALAATLSACSDGSDSCGNDVIARSRSPSGRLDAVMFNRDCGATTGFSTQVSIVGPGGNPTGGGNAFRADDDHGAAVAGHWGGSWAEIKWLAPDHLLIRYA